jgi:hypothetical protein
MRGKVIVILLLLAILSFTVYQMMRFETSIREERRIRLYVEDETKPLLTRLTGEQLKEAALGSDYYFTAGRSYFRRLRNVVLENGKSSVWEDFFLKGVNLGVAVPGKFPAEFSLGFDDYLDWLKLIGEMNSNLVRTYTILPPEFYDALAFYNLHHHDKPVYLMQGVWIEVPENENYYDPVFMRGFQKEIMHAIDAIHGRAVLGEQPGKASGTYSTDVSGYVAALLLGREWEPASVFKTNRSNGTRQYCGDFVCMNDGNAMEAWLAGMLDFAVLYETQEYRFQHPVSFVNWLPLDPMYHDTEIIESKKIREYDNDLESIDFTRFNATELFVPGIYAAYHVYPYYPDFIYLQDDYRDFPGRDSSLNSYYLYLRDLKEHTPGMPLVIAEYGLPSSRGNSHFTPSGFNQGGHSEAEQARLSLILTRDIVQSGCAGAVYFEWIDEWFKHNWLVMDFEQPEEDRKIWHNMENPEQNFGICAMENKTRVIDGDASDWPDEQFADDSPALACNADASYFYIASRMPGFDLSRHNLYIALDTYDKDKGDHRLPFNGKNFDIGFEFLVSIKSPQDAAILVDEPYSVFTDIYHDHIPVYASRKNENGSFIRQLMLTNRGRISLLGKVTEPVLFDRSTLQFGKSSDPLHSNADWYFNPSNRLLELRLDWHMLNVSDPAKRFVLNDVAGTRDIEYTKTDGFRMYLFITDKNDAPVLQFPIKKPFFYSWKVWEKPAWSQRLKPLYYALQAYFSDLTPGKEEPSMRNGKDESFRITGFYQNKKGAVSISFDNAGSSQFELAIPVLAKYGVQATFGIMPEAVDEAPRIMELEEDGLIKRLSLNQIRELTIGHEIALQATADQRDLQAGLTVLEKKTNTMINTLHQDMASTGITKTENIVFIRKHPKEVMLRAEYQGVDYLVINPLLPINVLDSLLKSRVSAWTILTYHHLYEKPSDIPAQVATGKASATFIREDDFEKQLRLIRNHDYWIGTENRVCKYLREKSVSNIRTERFGNMIFMRIVNGLDQRIFNQPLTVEYHTSARIIRITGSESDGTYSNKSGYFFFNALPNKEVTIEIIE